MRKDIVCITCERLIEECVRFDEDHYNPHWICHNILEWWKLQEIGKLWVKNKDKFFRYLKKEVKIDTPSKKWAESRCILYREDAKCYQECRHEPKSVCCAFCERFEGCKVEKKICDDLEYSNVRTSKTVKVYEINKDLGEELILKLKEFVESIESE